jgi:hypothetical protein
MCVSHAHTYVFCVGVYCFFILFLQWIIGCLNHCIHTLRFAGNAKAAAIKEENEALKKAEVAVATSNAILREVCVCS